MNELNNNGDKLISTSGKHGSDISSQRMDELDMASVEYALQRRNDDISGIDIGCGYGVHGIRLSLLGVKMKLVDTLDIEKRIADVSEHLMLSPRLIYLKEDARNLQNYSFAPFDIVYSQRFIHYLSYTDANNLLKFIAASMKTNGKLFISASGLESELGKGYTAKNEPLHSRFHTLEGLMAVKHGIKEPICLYTEEDMRTLVLSYNFKEERIWTSAFGNIKAIFSKK